MLSAKSGLLQIINMFFSVKNTIFTISSPPSATQTLTPPSPPSMTISGCHELPLLVVEPPHQEEHFNQSGILRILLKDSVEKIPPILHFKASLRLVLSEDMGSVNLRHELYMYMRSVTY
ncbi:hypothetical protein HKD37_03G007061 [Glycine soja]